MDVTSILIDLRNIRCKNCKVALHDELSTHCPVCNATFDSVSSNHVGLAEKLQRRRDAAGIQSCDVAARNKNYNLAEQVSS